MIKLSFFFASSLMVLLLLLLLAIPMFAQVVPPARDTQLWFDASVTTPLIKKKGGDDTGSEKLSLTLFGTFRAGRNVSRPTDERVGAGFDFVVNKHIAFAPSYLYRAVQPVVRGGNREYEHRIRFDTTFSGRWSKFSLRDRNRVEYRIRHLRDDTVRYRNRLTLTVPIKKNGAELFAPFAATEPFYDFREKRWTRNELSFGVGKKLRDNLNGEFYYLWQHNRGAAFLRDVHAVGINLRFKYDRESDAEPTGK